MDKMEEDDKKSRNDEELRAAKGALWGCVLGLLIWGILGMIIALCYYLVQCCD